MLSKNFIILTNNLCLHIGRARYIGIPFEKGQIGQSQSFWRSHEAGYKTRRHKESSSFYHYSG